MPVDLRKAFVPVTNLVTNLLVLTVNPDKVPSKTFPEFVEFARKANPPLFYASIGNGSQHHIAMELLKRTAKHQSHACALQGRRPGRRSRPSAAKPSPCSAAARSCRWCARASCARSP